MTLLSKIALRNILNGRNNLGTPELRATVAAMKDEQRDNALVFLKCITEELVGLSDGRGIQAVAEVRNPYDYHPTIEPNAGCNPVRIIPKSADRVASNVLPKLKTFPCKSKMALDLLKSLK